MPCQLSLSGGEVIDDTRRIVEGSGADRFARIDLDSTIGFATLEIVPYQFSGSERAISGDDVEASVFATTKVGTDREEGKRIVHGQLSLETSSLYVAQVEAIESSVSSPAKMSATIPSSVAVISTDPIPSISTVIPPLAIVWFTVSFISVILGEDTASVAEIFPVLHRDRGSGIDADRTSSVLGNLFFDSRIGVDDDEHPTTVVVADADFEVVVDRVVVDDVVHVWFPLGPVSRPPLGHPYYTILRQEVNPSREYSQNWG